MRFFRWKRKEIDFESNNDKMQSLYHTHSNMYDNIHIHNIAHVAELVDAHGSGPCVERRGGSNPSVGTRR